jgi:hypothetical protein
MEEDLNELIKNLLSTFEENVLQETISGLAEVNSNLANAEAVMSFL